MAKPTSSSRTRTIWVKDVAEKLRMRRPQGRLRASLHHRPSQGTRRARKELHKEVENASSAPSNKEMSGRPIPDIEALIVSHTKADEPADV
jgi:hypothetical protein